MPHLLPRRLLLAALALAGSAPLPAADAPAPPPWPEITATAKPWTRWWWLGNIVNERDSTALMESYAAAGLGGLEITPIYGVVGQEERFLSYLSPAWVHQFRHVLAEGRRLGLGLDLATGTGWPFGGPWVDDATACRYLAHRSWQLRGGEHLAEPVTLVQRPLLRAIGRVVPASLAPTPLSPGAAPAVPAARARPPAPRIEDLRAPLTANPDLQALAVDQVRFPRPLPLVALVAFSAAGERADLTARVGPEGRLDWTAPAGDWTLHGLFAGWHGKMVERAAPGGEGNVIDHFSSRALAAYLRRFDEALADVDLTGLRGFYNDSYEVDDAQGESDWTPDFFAQFARRRGYDLREQLPALVSPDDTDTTRRVLTDYRETLSDLLLEEFTQPWRDWARARGRQIRNQAHGSPANLLDLYAASDIPEQEGDDLVAIKLASSAAHVTGKRLTAAETATWLDEHFSSTLGDIKRAVDTFLLGGVNHNCYHGTAYSPPAEPWPGFHFYASVELNPSNPVWTDFPALNAYVARAQAFLQSGEPDEGVLLYYNLHDRWAEPGLGERGGGLARLPHFHGRARERVGARTTADRLHAAGHGFDFISDRLLAGVTAGADGRLVTGGQRYHALLLPPTRTLPLATLQHLVQLAESGATILVEGDLPADVPGLGVLPQRRQAFVALLARVRAAGQVRDGLTEARLGRGRFVIGPDAPALLAFAGVPPETVGRHGLQFVRRQTTAGALYFLANRSAQDVDGWVELQSGGESADLYDPLTGRSGRAAFRAAGPGRSAVYLQLPAGATGLVQVHEQAPPPRAGWAYHRPGGASRELAGAWTVEFVAGGPSLPPPQSVALLTSWTEWGGADLRLFSGSARYRITFPRPDGSAAAWRLDLGRVAESARVSLNGRDLGTLIAAPWTVLIPAADLGERNVLEVTVTNLAANRIAGLDRRGEPWKKFYNVNMAAHRAENRDAHGVFTAARWLPRPSGLLGPVTLGPVERLQPEMRP